MPSRKTKAADAFEYVAVGTMSTREIVYNYARNQSGMQMSGNPSTQTGRGLMDCGFDSTSFEGIYGGIVKHAGSVAAKAYVNMTAALPDDSTTGFLIRLEDLQRHGWSNASQSDRGNAMDVAQDVIADTDRRDPRAALAQTAVGLLFGGGRPQRNPLDTTGQFLLAHRHELDAQHQGLISELERREAARKAHEARYLAQQAEWRADKA